MGKLELVLTVGAVIAAIASAADESFIEDGHYHTKYDHVDIDDVYNHRRLVHHYAMCLINRGPCPPETADLKHVLPEILETSCKLCTEKQVHIILVSIQRIRADHPALWKQLIELYDPDDVYISKFEEKHDHTTPVGDHENLLARRSPK